MTKTYDAMIPLDKNCARSMKNGTLRITLDVQDADIMETSRLLSMIGTPLTITLVGHATNS